MSRTYNIFISYSWAYSDAYQKLINLLKQDPSFNFKDYSVLKNNSNYSLDNESEFKKVIEKQILPCSVVLILAGVYSSYSKWIDKEIEITQDYHPYKKIIAIEPWGPENTSKVIKYNADKIVKWDYASVVEAIKELG